MVSADIPIRIKDALHRYVNDHIKPGDFLFEFLSNNLYATILRADDECKQLLIHIYFYVSNNLPSESWGSEEKVSSWLKLKK